MTVLQEILSRVCLVAACLLQNLLGAVTYGYAGQIF
jgi:hypothetical protein